MLLELYSVPQNVAHVEPMLNQVATEVELGEELYGDILISLTEAVNNAILHGNKADASKVVRIIMKRQSAQLSFLITDEGEGFDPKKIPDPTATENLLTIGGRGVFLMQQLCHDLQFHDNGRTVEMRFKL
jgi:serine/threonine-protein kinase RsbW